MKSKAKAPKKKVAKKAAPKKPVAEKTMMTTGAEAHQRTDIIIPQSQERIIRDVYAKGLDDNEFEVFKMICRRTRLDPTKKQIVAVKRWNKAAGKEIMTPQTTIDGYRAIGNREGTCAGVKTVFHYGADGTTVEGATTTIKKVLKSGIVAEFEGYAKMSEYIPAEKDAFMYKQKPHVMIGKCSEALAWRRAYPEDMSGIYIEEELMMSDAPVAMVFDDEQVIEMLEKCQTMEEYKVVQNDIAAMKYKISNMDTIRNKAIETLNRLNGKKVEPPKVVDATIVGEPTEAEKEAIRKKEKQEYNAEHGIFTKDDPAVIHLMSRGMNEEQAIAEATRQWNNFKK